MRYDRDKKEFLMELLVRYGQPITYTPYDECGLDKNGNPTIIKSDLYYKGDKHIGTWSNGKGVIF